ncbi:unnamed protein product [Clavelina lepadiformis]|uniref:FGFR1 oncogene partner (FOP) N-terminal dimerisation domain-containing protein n=1 Tax=Clavelina lepadiformis TaxID=159417 RepID=A0ABP0EZZ4_CLALP
MSAVDEDTELRDLLVQTLDKNGVLGKIKAELRASIFLALEAQDQLQNPAPLANKKLQNCLSEVEGQTCIDLIHDFLNFFNLDYTREVFVPESSTNNFKSRAQLCHQLSIKETGDVQTAPALVSLVKERTKDTLSEFQVKSAQGLFMENCKYGSDSISQKTAVDVLSKLSPGFPVFLLERFVVEEASSLTAVNCRKFIQIYEKLYTACHGFIVGVQTSIPQSSENSFDGAKSEQEFIQQTVGLSEKQSDSFQSSDPLKHSISPSKGVPVDYLKPAVYPDDTMDVAYDQFFDDDIYSKPKDLPDTFVDARPTNVRKLPPVLHNASEPSKTDWSQTAKSSSFDEDKKQSSLEYEDDFNTTSHASITEDIHEDSLLSSESSAAELTEDRSLSERHPAKVDYMEDIKKY